MPHPIWCRIGLVFDAAFYDAREVMFCRVSIHEKDRRDESLRVPAQVRAGDSVRSVRVMPVKIPRADPKKCQPAGGRLIQPNIPGWLPDPRLGMIVRSIVPVTRPEGRETICTFLRCGTEWDSVIDRTTKNCVRVLKIRIEQTLLGGDHGGICGVADGHQEALDERIAVGKSVPVLAHVHFQSESNLPHVIQANYDSRLFSGSRQRWRQQSGQDGDYGDDHEKFD